MRADLWSALAMEERNSQPAFFHFSDLYRGEKKGGKEKKKKKGREKKRGERRGKRRGV